MAKKYISNLHTIDAFRFTKKQRKLPDWFIEAVHEGKASVTINHKDRYITIYGKDQEEKAYHLDWVCLSPHGKLYVLEDKVFNECYIEE